MSVFCIIPVFNRLEHTRSVVELIKRQRGVDCKIIIVDDGSTDGTGDFLAKHHPDVIVVKGTGNWWWTRSMQEGVKVALGLAKASDFILFQNNDTTFAEDYVEILVRISEALDRCAVGSALVSQENGRLFSLGPHIDFEKCEVSDIFNHSEGHTLTKFVDAQALSGRGALYPIEVFKIAGSLRYKLLPHYWADYEFSNRVYRRGIRLVISLEALVTTSNQDSGIQNAGGILLKSLFSRRSRNNIRDAILFFSLSGPLSMRMTAVPRVLCRKLWRGVNRAV